MSKIANDGLTRSGTGCFYSYTHMAIVGVKAGAHAYCRYRRRLSRVRCECCSVEKAKWKRRPRNWQYSTGRAPKSSNSEDSSDQTAALALGLGPRFNWLENKINTMQAGTTLMSVKPRPVPPKPAGRWRSSGAGGGTRTAVVVVTATTTTSSTMSSPQTTVALQRRDTATTQSSADVG